MHFSEKYSINDLEKLSGIKAHTLRIWEKRYALLDPHRTETNIRYYSNNDLRRILNIGLLNKSGIKISTISKMSPSEIEKKVLEISMIKTANDDYIENLIIAMIDINEAHYEKIFSTCILRMGFEETILNVVFPFLQRIGVMWQAGGINIAQEHFMSNIIRQKLIVATDSLKIIEDKKAPTALLFLPENELHELGLLFYNYILKAKKYKTIYLGQALPLKGLDRVIGICNPDILITLISTKIAGSNLDDFFKELSKAAGKNKAFITGRVALDYKKPLPSNLKFFKDLAEFKSILGF